MIAIDPSDKRNEIKRRLETNAYKPLVHVVLDATGRRVQKLTRQHEPIPASISATLIALIVLLTSIIVSLLLGEFSNQIRVARMPSELALVALTALGIIIFKQQIDLTYGIWYTYLLDAVETNRGLCDIERWFAAFSQYRRQLLLGLFAGLPMGIYAAYYVTQVRGYIGIGPILLNILTNVLVFFGLYYILLFVNLPLRIRQLDFRLFALYPRRSEVIHHLSDILFSFVYKTAFLIAAITLVLSLFAEMNVVNILLLVLLGWSPILIAFFLSQHALSTIIVRGKWRILADLQARIEVLHANPNITETEVVEQTNRLLDLHNRMWSSQNSVFDMESITVLITSLLLPLITLFIGSLPTIIGLFRA